MSYPKRVFTDEKRGHRWLKSIPKEELKDFVKNYLETGDVFPFQRLNKDYNYPCDSFFYLIDSFGDNKLEREIGEVTEELLEEVSPEEDQEYFYNVINAAADFNLKNPEGKTFEKLYEYATNKDLAGEKVYGEDLYKSVLGCLFSFRVPKEYEDEVIELCEENIEEDLYRKMCAKKINRIEKNRD